MIISNVDGRRTVTGPGARLRTGDRLETLDNSRAAFVLPGGASVSVDRGSRVVLEGRGSLVLDGGAVYVDTGSEDEMENLSVRTAHGIVRHLGTQFEVRVVDSGLRVRVREATVAVERARRALGGGAGRDAPRRARRPPGTTTRSD